MLVLVLETVIEKETMMRQLYEQGRWAGLLLLLILATSVQADVARIARFQGDRVAAVSLTFDDGLRNQYELAVPLLAKYGFHATFGIIAGTVTDTDVEALRKGESDFGGISWAQVKALAQQGHEIANHSFTHPDLTLLNDAALEKEITSSYQRITEKIGTPPLTFFYPGNAVDARVRQAMLRQHLFARETEYSYGGDGFAAQSKVWVDDAIAHGAWIVAMIHGITEGYSHFTSVADFENHLAYLRLHEAQVWVDTFANVGRYTRERDNATLSVDQHGTSAVVTLTCSLDPTRYHVPLTIVLPAPSVATALAQRAGAAIPLTVRKDSIVLDVPPATAPVTITWTVKD